MPFDSVFVNVIEQSHAGFHAAVDVELGIVRLGNVVLVELRLVTGVGPGLVAPTGWGGVGGRHLNTGSGPEPTVDMSRLQVLAVTPLEVAQAAARPNVWQILCKKNNGRWYFYYNGQGLI